MSNQASVRAVLLAVIIVGGLGAVSTHMTAAEFTDSHAADGQISAASNFNNGGTGLTADAGGPYMMEGWSTLTLDGSRSSIDQGNIQRYDWDLISGPGGGYYNPNTPSATYYPPFPIEGTSQAVIELTVTDNKGNTATDTTTITIQESNTGNVNRVGSQSAESPGNKGTKKVYFGNYTGR